MAVFIVSYDLRKPDFDYKPLYAALAKANAVHLQDSVWGLRTSSSADAVWKYLWQHMHSSKDRLFVVPFDKSADYKSVNAMTQLKEL
jgi:hypothetical protein